MKRHLDVSNEFIMRPPPIPRRTASLGHHNNQCQIVRNMRESSLNPFYPSRPSPNTPFHRLHYDKQESNSRRYLFKQADLPPPLSISIESQSGSLLQSLQV